MASEGVNWHLCCLCQTDGDREMRFPAQSKRLHTGASYISLSESLSVFADSDMPTNILNFLSSDANLLEKLMINNAKFHKSCLNKLIRLNRIGKRHYEKVKESECASPTKTINSCYRVQRGQLWCVSGTFTFRNAYGKLLGDWLRHSGWIEMLINVEVTTSGGAEAMLKGTHM